MIKTLMAIMLPASIIILSVFAFFAAFHYCERKEPERYFMICLGVFALMVAVVTAIGILNT